VQLKLRTPAAVVAEGASCLVDQRCSVTAASPAMSDELFSVRGQVVLVSGGTRGIGRALAEGFAKRGAQVVLTGRTREAAEAAASEISRQPGQPGEQPPVCGLACDVADADAIERLVTEVVGRFGRIDTLLNVAGMNRRMPAEQLTLRDYDDILDVNLRGAFWMAHAVGRHMLSRRQGCQIHVTSINNDRPLIHVAPYAMSKAGLGQLTRALACEWGPRGVRVNAIAPGFILTDLTRGLWSRQDMQEWGYRNTPLGRLGQPEDLVGTALFLASPAAAFITGQIIYVDGGFTCGYRWPIDAS
jgi:NAD(P)-dependent dehydrogenase (short-subunit alcohol dehydrogenase family)